MTTLPRTLVQRIEHWAAQKPNAPAIHGKKQGRWVSLTWSQYWRNVQDVAKALVALGHEPGECVALCGANQPEWVQYQFGIQAARGVPAPIYGNATTDQLGYIVKDSAAKIAVVDGPDPLRKLLNAETEGLFPALEHVLFFDAFDVPADLRERVGTRGKSFDEVLALGRAQNGDEAEKRLAALDPNETCILIYTSGTTGKPKGVEISAAGQLVIGEGTRDFAPQFYDGSAEYHAISYLPLSHQAEQLLTNVVSLQVGGQVYFCPEITQVRDYLAEVRPTVFLGVPRVWEKFEAALRGRIGQATGFRAKLAKWAMDTEFACFEQQVERGVPARSFQPLKRRVASKLVTGKVKTALGLDRLEIAITGSAPMSPETQRFFASLGITVFEVYGMTENSGAVTISDPLKPRFGTVGKPFRGVKVRIGPDDEIQVKGPNNVKGYRGLPEESAALYTEDGWLRTGDAGALDAEGNVKITGRLKELLITGGGKNVAPIELEFYLTSIVGVGQSVVVGDGKPYLCALLALDPEHLDALADAAGVPRASMAELAANPKVKAHLEREVQAKCNAKVARYQSIKKISVLPAELTVEGGELTPSMKLRRKPINEKYAAEIEHMYEGGTLNTPEAHA
ncbi:MAG: long-chain fatty acid--CoA ligase [Sandaracinus sp.]|nr:long-chain fatty acid--CoA ligase [Myxococcales bacterium]MCB9616621.1 long-chain fatty acid--CoA ligase [Sandaracinus sp.]MCB9621272.1 long-chain fatty acid--CoA ligase [Sandaracinus sp.]